MARSNCLSGGISPGALCTVPGGSFAQLAYPFPSCSALFKGLYFLSWPVLGSAVLWTLMPTPQQMEQVGSALLGRSAGFRSQLAPMHTYYPFLRP